MQREPADGLLAPTQWNEANHSRQFVPVSRSSGIHTESERIATDGRVRRWNKTILYHPQSHWERHSETMDLEQFEKMTKIHETMIMDKIQELLLHGIGHLYIFSNFLQESRGKKFKAKEAKHIDEAAELVAVSHDDSAVRDVQWKTWLERARLFMERWVSAV
jgi:hypothetical protein